MRFTKAHNIKSALAEELGINNYPGVDISHCPDSTLEEEVIFYNLELLHLNCVGPILDAFEGNIGIKSAYRCEELNKAMGGSPNSQHIRGYAIDLVSPTFPTATLFDWVILNLPEWNQVIWEYPERGQFSSNNQNSSWLSISYIKDNNPKTKSVSSKIENLHKAYENDKTSRIGDYTHNITSATEFINIIE